MQTAECSGFKKEKLINVAKGFNARSDIGATSEARQHNILQNVKNNQSWIKIFESRESYPVQLYISNIELSAVTWLDDETDKIANLHDVSVNYVEFLVGSYAKLQPLTVVFSMLLTRELCWKKTWTIFCV